MLENLPADTLPRLLRRTTVSALIVGMIAFVVAGFLAPFAALGVAIGIGLALWNFRMLDKQVAKVETGADQSTKAVRRKLRGRTISRLGLLTVIAIGAIILSAPLGIGIVSGLVLYQIVFVANVFRVVAAQGGIE